MTPLLKKAIDQYGPAIQISTAMEEMGELIAALNRTFFRGRDDLFGVIEEIADVEIMLSQLRILVGTEKVSEIKLAKLERLAARLNGESKNETL